MDASQADLAHRIGGVAALDQPLRRDLYRLLGPDGWITRDEAAAALDIPRSVAAFHLDKLAEAGVVEVRFERTSGRQGPGAGRPSKLYRRRGDEISASVPERHYELAGSLLAAAIAESTRSGLPVRECLHAVARTAGRRVGEQAGDRARAAKRVGERRQAVVDVLAGQGYEPEVGRHQEITLVNCPFHRLAEEQRELVCGMNLDFVSGVLEGMEPADPVQATLDPVPGQCCVRIAPARGLKEAGP